MILKLNFSNNENKYKNCEIGDRELLILYPPTQFFYFIWLKAK